MPRALRPLVVSSLIANLGSAAVEAVQTPGPSSPGPSPYRLTDATPGVKRSYYQSRILKFLDHWPPPTLTITDNDREIYTRAIRTPGHPKIIGMVKHFNVRAPIEHLARVTERFEEYPSIWNEVVRVSVKWRDRNRTGTEWTRKAPTFFMPQIHYQLLYISDRTQPGRIVYRQQLLDGGNALESCDALVVFEARGEKLTRVSVANFFNPDAGPFRSIVEPVIWKKSYENSFKDDFAFRARAENSDWSLKQITEQAEKALETSQIHDVIYTSLLKFDP